MSTNPIYDLFLWVLRIGAFFLLFMEFKQTILIPFMSKRRPESHWVKIHFEVAKLSALSYLLKISFMVENLRFNESKARYMCALIYVLIHIILAAFWVNLLFAPLLIVSTGITWANGVMTGFIVGYLYRTMLIRVNLGLDVLKSENGGNLALALDKFKRDRLGD